MRTQLTFLLVFFIVQLSLAQDTTQVVKADTLVFRNQIKLKVKITEVEPTLVRYRKMNNLEGPVYSTYKSDILKICYANGTVDRIDSLSSANRFQKKAMPGLSSFGEDDQRLYNKGAAEARENYRYRGDAIGTGITSFLFGAFGLIPAIVNSTRPVKDKHLGNRHPELWENTAYQAGYRAQAKRMKVKRVWNGFWIGLGSGVVVSLLILPSN